MNVFSLCIDRPLLHQSHASFGRKTPPQHWFEFAALGRGQIGYRTPANTAL
jgi:hypothetical protein